MNTRSSVFYFNGIAVLDAGIGIYHRRRKSRPFKTNRIK